MSDRKMSIYGASRAALQQSKKEEAEKLIREWIKDLLGLDVGDDVQEAIEDGVVLCSIINTLVPGSIPKVNPAPKLPFKKMENVNNFLKSCEKVLWMPPTHLFDSRDLTESKNLSKVYTCLLNVADIGRKKYGKATPTNSVRLPFQLPNWRDSKRLTVYNIQKLHTMIAEEEKKHKQEEIMANFVRTASTRTERRKGREEEMEELKRKQDELEEAERKEKEERERIRMERWLKEKEEYERQEKEREAKEKDDQERREREEKERQERHEKIAETERIKEEQERRETEERERQEREENERLERERQIKEREEREERERLIREEAERLEREEQEMIEREEQEERERLEREEAERLDRERREKEELEEKLRIEREERERQEREELERLEREKEEQERREAEERAENKRLKAEKERREQEDREAELKSELERQRIAKERQEREEREARERKEKKEREEKERHEREERERQKREQERKEREEREKKEREEKEKREKEERERREREEKERREREERERREREERERKEREERERREREGREREEKERREREEKERKEREENERKEREEREKKERAENERKEREERERIERERIEREKKETEEKEKIEKENKEKEEKEKAQTVERREPMKLSSNRTSVFLAAHNTPPTPAGPVDKTASPITLKGGSHISRPPSSKPFSIPSPTAPAVINAKISNTPTSSPAGSPFFGKNLGKSKSSTDLPAGGTLPVGANRPVMGVNRSSPKPAAFKAHTLPAKKAPDPNTNKGKLELLLMWCQQQTEGYHGVNITNFTTSWKDGFAFCALVHKHMPGKFDYKETIDKTPTERLTLAFETAAQKGIAALLDPEDIVDLPVPEKLSIITYITVLYSGFNK